MEPSFQPQLWFRAQVCLLCCDASTFSICSFLSPRFFGQLYPQPYMFLFSPLDQSVCAGPVWPWQSFPCRWSSVAGSFRCAASHLNIKRWSYDIVRRESGWTSQCLSLNGWLTGRYAAIKQERDTIMSYHHYLQNFSHWLLWTDSLWFILEFSCVSGQKTDDWTSESWCSTKFLPFTWPTSSCIKPVMCHLKCHSLNTALERKTCDVYDPLRGEGTWSRMTFQTTCHWM